MVWVNGLSPNMTEQALVEVFRQFGMNALLTDSVFPSVGTLFH